MDLLAKDKQYIWHPFSPLKGSGERLLVKSAKDCTITLEDNRALIDAISSWWVNPLGHCNKAIADAVYEQMLTLEHVIFAGYTHEPAINLSEKVLSLTKHNFSKVFFSDNGSTSVEVGLKIAIQHFYNKGTAKQNILCFSDAYHGDTFGAMAVGQKGSFFKAFEEFLFEPISIDTPTDANWDNYLERLEKLLASEKPAAFMFEPLIQGAGGMKMYRPEHLDTIVALCKKHDCITIADEVMTGFGRTGKMFATDYLVNKPDIMCLSKCLTGGFLPMSITLVNEKVISEFDNDDPSLAFYHGHSYTGNPIGCAAANAALALIDSPECKANWERINTQHQSFAEKLKQHPLCKNIRITGTVLAFDVEDEVDGYFSDIKKKLSDSFLSSGVLLRPLGNVVYIMPPYIITDEELAKVYQAIIVALEKLNSSVEC